MMKVPRSVIHGKSPMKTVCSRISPVSRFWNATLTFSGREYVMSFSRHSSTVLGGSSNSKSPKTIARFPV